MCCSVEVNKKAERNLMRKSLYKLLLLRSEWRSKHNLEMSLAKHVI